MKFSVGEIAIVIRSGREVEITGEPKVHRGLNRDGSSVFCIRPCYSTRSSDGFEGWCHEDRLRKKKPPEEEINWVEFLDLKIKEPA